VQLIDLSAAGESAPLIGPTTLAGAGSWTNVRRVIDPTDLSPGDSYLIQITTRYTSGTSVLVSGSADYDNVVLSATPGGAGGQGGGGKKGKRNTEGAGGALSPQRLEELLRGATPGTATLHGQRLFVRVKCPRKIGHACRTTAQGLLKKSRPATRKRTVLLRSGKA
jgi:hypothetical protein